MRVEPLLLTEITTANWHPTPNTVLPVYGYVVVHPAGPMLVDTGVGSGNNFIDEQYRPRHHALADALAGCGLQVADIQALINTHLHFDHCGQNSLFPGIPIYVQAAEVRAAEDERYTVKGWIDFDRSQYEVVAGEREIATGVRLIPAPWHTPGHQVVTVAGSGGLVLIAGQAAETMEEFESSEACRPFRELAARLVYLSHVHPH